MPALPENAPVSCRINDSNVRKEYGVELTSYPDIVYPEVRARQRVKEGYHGTEDYGAMYGPISFNMDFQIRALTKDEARKKVDDFLQVLDRSIQPIDWDFGNKTVYGIKFELGHRHWYTIDSGTIEVANDSPDINLRVDDAEFTWYVKPRVAVHLTTSSGVVYKDTVEQVLSDTHLQLQNSATTNYSALTISQVEVERRRYLFVNHTAEGSIEPFQPRALMKSKTWQFSIPFEAVMPFVVGDTFSYEVTDVDNREYVTLKGLGKSLVQPTFHITGPITQPKLTAAEMVFNAEYDRTTGSYEVLNDVDPEPEIETYNIGRPTNSTLSTSGLSLNGRLDGLQSEHIRIDKNPFESAQGTVSLWLEKENNQEGTILSTGNVTLDCNCVHYYYESNDTLDNSWKYDSSKSWYTEVQDYTGTTVNPGKGNMIYDSTSITNVDGADDNSDYESNPNVYTYGHPNVARGYQRGFPKNAVIAATDQCIWIFTLKDTGEKETWMRFLIESNNYLGSSVTPEDLYMFNGKLYIAGGAGDGLIVVDFVNDQCYKYDSSGRTYHTLNIANRNSDGAWSAYDSDWALADDDVIGVHVNEIENDTYIATGTNGGLSVVDVTDEQVLDYDSDNYTYVKLSGEGNLYGANDTDNSLCMWTEVQDDSTNQASEEYTYDETSTPAIYISATTISGLELVEDGSNISSTSDRLYIAHNQGITELNINESTQSNGSVKYYKSGYGANETVQSVSEEQIGNVKGSWSLDDNRGTTIVEDISVTGNDLTSARNTSVISQASGIRHRCLDITAGTDSLSVASTDFDFTTEDFSVSMWLEPNVAGAAELAYVGDKSTTGWRFYKDANEALHVVTHQAGPTSQDTYTANNVLSVSPLEWQHIGFSRTGSTITIYLNGEDVTSTSATHVDPAAVGAGTTLYVCTDNAAANDYDGKVDEVLITQHALSSSEFSNIHNRGLSALEAYKNELVVSGTGTLNTGTMTITDSTNFDTNDEYNDKVVVLYGSNRNDPVDQLYIYDEDGATSNSISCLGSTSLEDDEYYYEIYNRASQSYRGHGNEVNDIRLSEDQDVLYVEPAEGQGSALEIVNDSLLSYQPIDMGLSGYNDLGFEYPVKLWVYDNSGNLNTQVYMRNIAAGPAHVLQQTTTNLSVGTEYLVTLKWDDVNDDNDLGIGTTLQTGSNSVDLDLPTNAKSIWLGSGPYGKDSIQANTADISVIKTAITDAERTSIAAGAEVHDVLDQQYDQYLYLTDNSDALTTTDQFITNDVTLDVHKTTSDTVYVSRYANDLFSTGDRAICYDGTGFKSELVVDGAPSPTQILDDGSATDLDKVGVYAELDSANSEYFNGGNIHDITTEDIAISLWFKRDGTSSNNDGLVTRRQSGITGVGYGLYITSTDKLFMRVADAGPVYTSDCDITDYLDNKWHNIVIFIDRDDGGGGNNNSNIYIDGSTKSSEDASAASATISNSIDFNLGAFNNGTSCYSGSIKDVRIWYAADLNDGNNGAHEALELATSPLGSSVTFNGNSEDGWWKMTDSASSATLADSSGNGNTLDLQPTPSPDEYGTHSRTQQADISRNLSNSNTESNNIGAWQAGTNVTLTPTNSTVKLDNYGLKLTNSFNGEAGIEWVHDKDEWRRTRSTYQEITRPIGVEWDQSADRWIGVGHDSVTFSGWIYTPTGNNSVSGNPVVAIGPYALTIADLDGADDGAWHYVNLSVDEFDENYYLQLYTGSDTDTDYVVWDM